MKSKEKIFIILLIFMLNLSCISFADELESPTNTTETNIPKIASEAAILAEKSTGKILYEKNAYKQMYPASTTKVMTAILTLENCDLNENVVASHNAITSIPSGYVTAGIQEGEILSVKDLLYALMVKSANDVAVVLAEHVAGSVEDFSNMMNEKALELGCQNTHFVNPNGIHNSEHYSTAYDLYLITSYCMENQTFRKYVSTTSYILPSTNLYTTVDRVLTTTNDMLRPSSKYYNENVIGVKTGYTTEAKNCLISAALKNNTELISVTLHAGTNSQGLSERYVDTEALFDYGFNNFEFKDIIKENDVVKNIEIQNANKETKSLDLIAKDTLSAYTNKDFDINTLEPQITLNEDLKAPISINAVLRKCYIYNR